MIPSCVLLGSVSPGQILNKSLAWFLIIQDPCCLLKLDLLSWFVLLDH